MFLGRTACLHHIKQRGEKLSCYCVKNALEEAVGSSLLSALIGAMRRERLHMHRKRQEM